MCLLPNFFFPFFLEDCAHSLFTIRGTEESLIQLQSAIWEAQEFNRPLHRFSAFPADTVEDPQSDWCGWGESRNCPELASPPQSHVIQTSAC